MARTDRRPRAGRLVLDPAATWPMALGLLLIGVGLYWYLEQRPPLPPQPPAAPTVPEEAEAPAPPATADDQPPAGEPGSYLFCFWNVENLFDDRHDAQRPPPDRPYDDWFARDAAARRLKYQRLSEALLKMNRGRGPDILAVAEVESLRAAELLKDALNEGLHGRAPTYDNVLMKEVNGGRHIATAVITRLPVKPERTRLHASRLRIMEGHVVVQGHDLEIIASHWSSKLHDEEGVGRDKYAEAIYKVYREAWNQDPAVDFLVCGDFNETPDDSGVKEHLRGTDDRSAVLNARGAPLLLDLFMGKPADRFGTHYYSGKWFIYDQILVSPGLLDGKGWTCDPSTARTERSLTARGGRPWRFGNEKGEPTGGRGYSDHFPVIVQLKVEGR